MSQDLQSDAGLRRAVYGEIRTLWSKFRADKIAEIKKNAADKAAADQKKINATVDALKQWWAGLNATQTISERRTAIKNYMATLSSDFQSTRGLRQAVYGELGPLWKKFLADR